MRVGHAGREGTDQTGGRDGGDRRRTVASRITTAISQASSSVGIDQSLEMSRTIWPTPESMRVCLKPPPAPTMRHARDRGRATAQWWPAACPLVKPAARRRG